MHKKRVKYTSGCACEDVSRENQHVQQQTEWEQHPQTWGHHPVGWWAGWNKKVEKREACT